MSTGGLEPPRLSPHAPQACMSTIPSHRQILNYKPFILHTGQNKNTAFPINLSSGKNPQNRLS